MSDVLEHLQDQILGTTDTTELKDLARAYADVLKVEVDNARLAKEIDEGNAKLDMEEKKQDRDFQIKEKQLYLDKRKIEIDAQVQMEKIEANHKDNQLMVCAMVGGIFIMYGCEKAGILLSRNAGQFFKLVRFVR